jgi:hypothetical protein
MDAPRVRVDLFEQVLDEGKKSILTGDQSPHGPPTALRFHRHEQIAVPARAYS